MKSTIEVLKSGMKAVNPQDNKAIQELVQRVLATRDISHMAHWSTCSNAQHTALGDIYEELPEILDKIVEAYQGKFGVVQGFTTNGSVMPECLCSHMKADLEWVEKNKGKVAKGCIAVGALIDELAAQYLASIYKLENLH